VIRRLGSLVGKRVVFGYDRYLLPDIDGYRDALSARNAAELVCRTVQADPEESLGILCCGTGMGMSIAANKFRGIYAARCMSVEDAELARSINNANVLCIAAKQGFVLNRAIIEAFIETPYNGRKLEELQNITQLEGATLILPMDAELRTGAGLADQRRTA
jgi:ribose 5-phosphate isomerase B